MATTKAARKTAKQRRGEKFETFVLMLLIALRRQGVAVRRCVYFRDGELVATAADADFVQVLLVSREGMVLSTHGDVLTVFTRGGTRLYKGTKFEAAVAAIKKGKKK